MRAAPTTHEPVTHLVDVITPGAEEVEVSALEAVSGAPQLDPGKVVVLSEGLELMLVGAAVSEEPRVVPDAHRGTYVLSNATRRLWSGTILCLRNHEQVHCGETSDVWSVDLEPDESAMMHISFRPVGPSGRGDHIQLVPIAGAGSEHIGRVGGVYASAAPDVLHEVRLSDQTVREVGQYDGPPAQSLHRWKPEFYARSVAGGDAVLAHTRWPLSPDNPSRINLIGSDSTLIPVSGLPDVYILFDAV